MKQPYLDTVIYDNFYEMLRGRVESSGKKVALRYRDGARIRDITYREMTDEIAAFYAFIRKHVKQGGHIGIVSENRYEYIIVYLASVFQHVIVPLDRELDTDTLASCIERFDLDALVYTNKGTEKVKKALQRVKEAKPTEGFCEINLDLQYRAILAGEHSVQSLFQHVKNTDKDRFAVLASTSGTDGTMKGVMLSQYNVITNIRGTLENNVLKNPTLAFLPMNHTYGFNPCILATLYNGTTVCLNLQIKYLMRDLKTYDPYFFGAVPMVIEGMYETLMREVKKQGKQEQFRRMLALSDGLRAKHIDLRHVFFGKIINKNLRLVVNGGAPLSAEYVEKFDRLGITILNGYGMTECSPTVAVSRVCNNVAGSAGTIMKHIDVKVTEDGELLVKGPCVMLGYYKDEAATKEVMRDGYLATGDLGYVEDRVIYINGRKKNLIILDNGKNVAPEYLERMIKKFPYVDECLVVAKTVARKRKILLAKLTLKEEFRFDSQKQTEGQVTQKEEDIRKLIMQDIRNVNASVPGYMRIEDYEVVEGFEHNSSRKILRHLYTEE